MTRYSNVVKDVLVAISNWIPRRQMYQDEAQEDRSDSDWSLHLFDEDSFDGRLEEAGQAEGQRQAWVESAGFDGVDALAREFEFFGQVGLAPVALGAEDAKTVLHWFLQSLNSRVLVAATTKMSKLRLPKGTTAGWRSM